jgi:prepilin-type processing-associated H-X9-DG protein
MLTLIVYGTALTESKGMTKDGAIALNKRYDASYAFVDGHAQNFRKDGFIADIWTDTEIRIADNKQAMAMVTDGDPFFSQRGMR